ncbi:Protein kinase domain-containing protein [Psidium guajava]|nr:Protein kinase domain-containing protein [Psidium guajava]
MAATEHRSEARHGLKGNWLSFPLDPTPHPRPESIHIKLSPSSPGLHRDPMVRLCVLSWTRKTAGGSDRGRGSSKKEGESSKAGGRGVGSGRSWWVEKKRGSSAKQRSRERARPRKHRKKTKKKNRERRQRGRGTARRARGQANARGNSIEAGGCRHTTTEALTATGATQQVERGSVCLPFSTMGLDSVW